jgi:hypothetical protein
VNDAVCGGQQDRRGDESQEQKCTDGLVGTVRELAFDVVSQHLTQLLDLFGHALWLVDNRSEDLLA